MRREKAMKFGLFAAGVFTGVGLAVTASWLAFAKWLGLID